MSEEWVTDWQTRSYRSFAPKNKYFTKFTNLIHLLGESEVGAYSLNYISK